MTGPAIGQLQFDLEARYFPQLETADESSIPSLAMQYELHPYAREGRLRYSLDAVAFARYCEQDAHADVRELIYGVATRDFEFRAGFSRVFWGVTEAAHWVDIINQDDWLEDLDGEDKLGQGMLSAAWTADWGIWRAYVLPHFRQRQFPEYLREAMPFPLDEKATQYESSRGKQQVDLAFRWKHYFGPLDIGLSWFRGTSREPRILPCARQGSGRPGTELGPNCDLDTAFVEPESNFLTDFLINLGSTLGLSPSRQELEDEFVREALADVDLVPHYDQIEQFGLELQWIHGGWAWKFEGRHRQQQNEWQTALAAGFEYTQGNPFGWPADFGYLIEYLRDDRDAAENLVLLDEDVLFGFRATFSDVAGTQFLGGVVVDLDGEGALYSFEGSRRLGDNYSVVVDMRVYSGLPNDDVAAVLGDMDQWRISISRYF